MSSRSQLTIVLAFVVTCVFCTSAFAQPQLSKKDMAAIKRVGQDFNRAFARNDRDAAVKMYAPDVVRMPPDGRPIKGRDAVLKTWDSHNFVTKSWEYTSNEIRGSRDVAYEMGSWKWTNVTGKGSEAITTTYSGDCISIYQRQPNGSWLIAAESWSVYDKSPSR